MKDSIQADWPAPPSIHAFTTTQTGWINKGNDAKTALNEQNLKNNFHFPGKITWLDQVHSNLVINLDQQHESHQADACYSRQSNQVCCILTADCLPLLLCNKDGNEIAAIHAGWRGLAAGIIDQTIKQLKSKPEELLVWLGPAIGPAHFEVGEDVLKAFSAKPENLEAFEPMSNQKWTANLYQLAQLNLKRLGVNDVFGGNFCTHTENDLFYSYRRDNGKTGRMASLIWINEQS